MNSIHTRVAGAQGGVAMIFVVIVGLALLMFTAVSVQMSMTHAVERRVREEAFMARQIADSGAAQALARIREGGYTTPVSGGGTTAAWVSFGNGEYYYYTTSTPAVSTIRAWGRVPTGPSPSSCSAAPDSVAWDGTDWMLQGLEITLRGSRYIPESPLYFGNGAIQKPLGGFDWASGADPADPSTWVPVASGADSYQSSWVPFQASALDHPADYLYNGGSPAPPTSFPHPYSIFAAQNLIGQFNIQAWFANSAGSSADPTTNVFPAPTSSYYDMSDPNSPDYAYPVMPSLPDVQSFAHALWSQYNVDPAATKLSSGTHSGTYGTLASPGITFVTGGLKVSSGATFKGCGVLVIRDDYDPNTQTANTPSTKARLEIEGTFQWTGLVIVAGWTPDIIVKSGGSANATIVGALFGEDSVQSGGEISLDSATIVLKIENTFNVLYSNALFQPGGPIHDFLPYVGKEVVSFRHL